MKALNDILSSYNSYRTEVKRMNEQKLEIESIPNANLTVVPTLPAVRLSSEYVIKVLVMNSLTGHLVLL